MFIIKKISDSSLHIWANKRSDDFLKYVPGNLNTILSDIEIYLLPDNCQSQLEHDRALVAKEENGNVSLDIYSGINIIDEATMNYEYVGFIKNCPAKLIEYPYNDDGDFVIPNEFIP